MAEKVHPEPSALAPASLGGEPGLHKRAGASGVSFKGHRNLKLTEFPEAVRHALMEYDVDEDGTVSLDEISRGAHLIKEQRAKIKTQSRMLIAMALVTIFLLTLVGLIVLAVVQLTRETRLDKGGIMVAARKSGGAPEVVQTANFMSAPTALHSALPDDAFSQLKTFSANSSTTGSHLSLMVLGFARLQGMGTCGSIIKLITAAGEVRLDGAVMTFSEEVGDVFVEAGFVLSADRRRLADSSQTAILGLFNYFMTIDTETLACNPLDPNALTLPTSYHIKMTRYRMCGWSGDATWCGNATGGLGITVTHPDFPGKRFFQETLELWDTGSISRMDTTYGTAPGRRDVIIRDQSTGLQRSAVQMADGTWANCQTINPNRNDTITGSMFDSMFNGMTPVRLGTLPRAVNGSAARGFNFTFTSGAAEPGAPSQPAAGALPPLTPILSISYFDTPTAPHRPLRIIVADLYPDTPPEESSNYVFDVVLYEPVTVFPRGTFLLSAPTTCAASAEAAMPPNPYPVASAPPPLTPDMIAQAEILPATGNSSSRHLLAVGGNALTAIRGGRPSGCIGQATLSSPITLPPSGWGPKIFEVSGVACSDRSFSVDAFARGPKGVSRALSGRIHAEGAGTWSSVEGWGSISGEITYDQWPDKARSSCRAFYCRGGCSESSSAGQSAAQRCRDNFGIRVGTISLLKTSDRVYVEALLMNPLVPGQIGLQYSHFFTAYSCGWWSTCNTNLRIYVVANFFSFWTTTFDLINYEQ